MNSAPSPSRDRFASMRWSTVLLLAGDVSPAVRDALGELARRYAYPVYAYVRRCGHAPASARALTRAALERLLHSDDLSRNRFDVRQYRHFLLGHVRSCLEGGAGDPAAEQTSALLLGTAAGLESRYQGDRFDADSPEQAFQRGFALVVLRRSLRRLRNEAAQTGHLDMYEALEPHLGAEPRSEQYESIAARLHVREVTLVLALKRLRQRLRELAAEERCDTIGDMSDLAGEREALLGVLGELKG